MFKTLPSDRVQLPRGMSARGESYWTSMTLSPATGAFLVDLDWPETKVRRTQSLLCPATVDSVAGMEVHELAILDIMFIPAPRHDGRGREPVLRVNAIDVALDPSRDFAQVLLVRSLDGHWQACAREVDLETLEDRREMLRVGKIDSSDGAVPPNLDAGVS